MTSSHIPVSTKTCTCDDKFIVFMKSEYFEVILKDAIQNVMGDIIRNILKQQIKEDLCTIINKTEQIALDLKHISSKVLKEPNGTESEPDEFVKVCDNSEDDEESSGKSDDSSRNEAEVGNKKNTDSGIRVQGVVRWFNFLKGYGFITVNDSLEEVFVHKSYITKPNPNSNVASLQTGETVEFSIIYCKKGPEARGVTGVNGATVIGSFYDPFIKRSMTKEFLKDYPEESRIKWNFHSNFRRGSRKLRPGIFSASTSIGGSRQSINGRAASSEGRSNKRGRGRNRFGNLFKDTLSADASHRGSTQSVIDNVSSRDPSYNHAYNMYLPFQYSSQPSTSSYYNYHTNNI